MDTPEQWLPSASDQEDRLPISEDVGRAYIDGRNEGRRDERARVRRELLETLDAWTGGAHPGSLRAAVAKDLRAALDRICPEKGE